MSLLLTCACGTDRSCLTFSCTLNLILNMESDFDFLIVGAGFSGLVKEENVSFVGWIERYQYFNMDQVTAMALKEFDRIAERYGLS